MNHLPNGTYPVKEVKVIRDNYIFILPNDLMVHTYAPHLHIRGVASIMIVNEDIFPLMVCTKRTKISASNNYRVLLTKEDIVEQLI